MQLTTSPTALPGACFKCRSGSREFYIDLDLSVDIDISPSWFGAVYICNECLQEMARLAGYETPEKVKELLSLREQQHSFIAELAEEIENLEKVVDGLSNLRSRPRVTPDPDPTLFDVVAEQTIPESGIDLGEEGGESSESLHDENVGELHADETPSTPSFKFGI